MNQIDGCQLPCLPKMSDGLVKTDPQPLKQKIKRKLAVPWNFYVKKWIKYFYMKIKKGERKKEEYILAKDIANKNLDSSHLEAGDLVKVRSFEEIEGTLDHFHELKGCAFLPYMVDYCGSTQRVLQPVRRFLDERDYKVKKARGVVLLENVICKGTPVFGQCDRACFLFWREEWLEKISEYSNNKIS